MASATAKIHILDSPYAIDRAYSYLVPYALSDLICPGVFVMVPFGKTNAVSLGIVVESGEEEPGQPLKEILQVCSLPLSLDPTFLRLCFFLKATTLCTIGDAVRAIVPSAALSRAQEKYDFADSNDILPDTPQESELLNWFRDRHTASATELRNVFGYAGIKLAKTLCEKGLLLYRLEIKDSPGPKIVNTYQLRADPETAGRLSRGEKVGSTQLRSQKHRSILNAFLKDPGKVIPEKDLAAETGCSPAQIRALCDKGILLQNRISVSRDPYANLQTGPKTEYLLNKDQEQCRREIAAMLDSGSPGAALLYGVTGSGKTCVILKSIEKALSLGKSAIVLLPEIALTPQSVSVFKNYFGNQVAVIHSGLSTGERIDAFTAIKAGRIRIVVGTRSAVFAPVRDLGLLVIDEEQEHTYKSDQNPKYHARDVARFRCADSNAVLLLCSATPSLESYHKAVEGTYRLLTLTQRYGTATLPNVVITDIREDIQSGNTSPIGATLLAALRETLSRNEQAILFLNRRGYNHYVQCASCRTVITCPNCSVSMTYHTVPGSYSRGYLSCHWCGTRLPVPSICPNCAGTHLLRFGYGTQRVEEELHTLLPGASVLRMDMDTTSTKASYDRILGQFRNHGADILLGTQMVTKGHDFPNVTLVGVLSADASLHLDDFRAAERTFSMLTQVIGRAGRADKPGTAVIQTENVENEIIRMACAQDYTRFYASEIPLRKVLKYPPFCDILLMTVSGTEEKGVLEDSDILCAELRSRLSASPSVPVILFGPFEAPVYRVDNNFRMRLVLKCRWNRETRAVIEPVYASYPKLLGHKSLLTLDVNPSSL